MLTQGFAGCGAGPVSGAPGQSRRPRRRPTAPPALSRDARAPRLSTCNNRLGRLCCARARQSAGPTITGAVAPGSLMQSQLSQFERHQLDVIARVTPHAMAGHLVNSTVLAVAVADSVPRTQLIIWCLYSYLIGLLLIYRHWRGRDKIPRSFARAAKRATIYALLLALPWGSMAALYLGRLPHNQELVVVALVVG